MAADHDTARFAAQTISKWCRQMSRARYPAATGLMIIADGGALNPAGVGYGRSRSGNWSTGVVVHLSRLFARGLEPMEQDRAPPALSHDAELTTRATGEPQILKRIGGTATSAGLRVKAALDSERYEREIKVTDTELKALRIKRDEFPGAWDYSVWPKEKTG